MRLQRHIKKLRRFVNMSLYPFVDDCLILFQQVGEGQRLQKALQAQYDLLKRAQATHVSAAKEADDAKSQREKAKNNPTIKPSLASKLDQKAQATEAKAFDSRRRLDEQQELCIESQEEHFNKQMPQLLEVVALAFLVCNTRRILNGSTKISHGG